MVETFAICKEYGHGNARITALNNIDFYVEKGDFVAIMGPSGSGKTTLMNILGCLERPTSGRYMLLGKDVGEMPENTRAEIRSSVIGFVFQSFNLLSWLTALENVELPMSYIGVPKRRRRAIAVEMLERLGLGDRLNHYPNQLSGGQRQRVAIARALVNNPQLLLADEPTGNLDTACSNDIMSIFRELNEEGRTIILITHEPEIAKYARRICVIRDGRLSIQQ